jgi:hypothetical protein
MVSAGMGYAVAGELDNLRSRKHAKVAVNVNFYKMLNSI